MPLPPLTPRTQPRRIFLHSALKGLGAMMLGCGHDQRPRDLSEGLGSTGGQRGTLPGEGGERSDGTDVGGEGDLPAGIFPDFGPLRDANALGIRLPEGYAVRLVAEAGKQPVAENAFLWPDFPDGGACFATSDGGWIYVANSEVNAGGGGVSALRFSSSGVLTDAYSIASGTSRNCQGGSTPGETWLTCEEVVNGRVIECDPLGQRPAEERLALGRFFRESVAYDLDRHHLYMTEDLVDGALYRFVPKRIKDGNADLSEGSLEVARYKTASELEWVEIPDPEATLGTATRDQVPDCAKFNGGEGVWWRDGTVYFTTKGDNRVWSLDTDSGSIQVLYDHATAENPLLSGVDDIIGTSAGELLVAEDAGDMQIAVILSSGELKALLQVTGQDASEITGLAFSPDGSRLYFSSQRGGPAGRGLTYEVTGPFTSGA